MKTLKVSRFSVQINVTLGGDSIDTKTPSASDNGCISKKWLFAMEKKKKQC